MIFPKEIAEATAEANFSRHSTRSAAIYLGVLFFLVAVLGLLPWIRMEVGVRSEGMIRPAIERLQIYSPVEGHVDSMPVRDENHAESGDVLLVIDPGSTLDQVASREKRVGQLTRYLEDVDLLSRADSLTRSTQQDLETVRYRLSLLEFLPKLQLAGQEMDRAKRARERKRTLAEKMMISRIESEEAAYEFENASHRYIQLYNEQLNQWSLHAAGFREEKRQLEMELESLRLDLDKYTLRAPLTGAILNMSGIQPGSFINLNQPVAEISPDTALVAELYVHPKDIGLLSAGMTVRLQIDSYSHNQWGILNGTITELSGDIKMIENRPVFKVRCSLEQTYLELPNGYRGKLKKGMTLQARSIIANRTLFQLLYDKVDNWLNPVWGPAAEKRHADSRVSL